MKAHSFNFSKWGVLALILFVSGFFVSACSFETSLSGLECENETEMRGGEVCRDGYWRIEADGGLGEDGVDLDGVSDTPPDPTQCTRPEELCGGECVDLQTDNANCGACGDACQDGDACVSGSCVDDTTCETGDERPCYTGPPNTRGEGLCTDGEQKCVDGEWGECDGEVLPGIEICDGKDNNCDGVADNGNPEGGGNCDTGEFGICKLGVKTCLGGELQCVPNETAAAEDECGPDGTGTGLDESCTGVADEGCSACIEGSTKDCYEGPDGTFGVGECDGGTRTCTGGAWGPCDEQTLPEDSELCDNLDRDCDGETHNGFDDLDEACPVSDGWCANEGVMICDPGDRTSTKCSVEQTPKNTYYLDSDGDGFGDPDVSIEACVAPDGYVDNKDDCDDSDGDIYRGATEVCNGVDNNCSGTPDDGTNTEMCGSDSQACQETECCDLADLGGPNGGNSCNGQKCNGTHAHCASGYCESIDGPDNDICLPAHCADDCGGSCLKCVGERCRDDDECKSNKCRSSGWWGRKVCRED